MCSCDVAGCALEPGGQCGLPVYDLESDICEDCLEGAHAEL